MTCVWCNPSASITSIIRINLSESIKYTVAPGIKPWGNPVMVTCLDHLNLTFIKRKLTCCFIIGLYSVQWLRLRRNMEYKYHLSGFCWRSFLTATWHSHSFWRSSQLPYIVIVSEGHHSYTWPLIVCLTLSRTREHLLSRYDFDNSGSKGVYPPWNQHMKVSHSNTFMY